MFLCLHPEARPLNHPKAADINTLQMLCNWTLEEAESATLFCTSLSLQALT
jgi:hypothetical protein